MSAPDNASQGKAPESEVVGTIDLLTAAGDIMPVVRDMVVLQWQTGDWDSYMMTQPNPRRDIDPLPTRQDVEVQNLEMHLPIDSQWGEACHKYPSATNRIKELERRMWKVVEKNKKWVGLIGYHRETIRGLITRYLPLPVPAEHGEITEAGREAILRNEFLINMVLGAEYFNVNDTPGMLTQLFRGKAESSIDVVREKPQNDLTLQDVIALYLEGKIDFCEGNT